MSKTVVLLRRLKEPSAQTGIGAYTDNIVKLLEQNSVEYGEVEMRMDLHSGVFRMLADGIVRPFFNTMGAKNDTKVFHSVDELCCIFFPLIRKSKKVLTCHHLVSERDGDAVLLPAVRLAFWIGIRWADVVVTVSDQTRNEILSRYDIDGSKVIAIPNRLSEEFVTLNIEKKKYIGCVSSLIPRKNVGSLLRIFKEFREAYGMDEYRLRICGKGPEEEALKALAEDLGIRDAVDFISGLSMKELLLFYNEASIVANPSMHEGFGFATLEAQICSSPVVYFEDAEIPEEVVRFAVPARDESDFARIMHELLTDKEFYDKVVREGQEYAGSFRGAQDRLLELYKELSE